MIKGPILERDVSVCVGCALGSRQSRFNYSIAIGVAFAFFKMPIQADGSDSLHCGKATVPVYADSRPLRHKKSVHQTRTYGSCAGERV